ncbi:hypothetical protein FS841_04990 [Escherichia coli]|nr:hypothetical protein FS841_04990 [Escherichia coli]
MWRTNQQFQRIVGLIRRVKRRIRHLGTAAGCGVNALSSLQNQHFQRTCRPDKTRHELNPKTWTVSVNRLFDTQSGILPG